MGKSFKDIDPELSWLIEKEKYRQMNTIQLIAAENVISKSTLYPLVSNFSSKTAEGTPGNRYHMGCDVVDELETLAEQRLCKLFNSGQAWVQPNSGSSANLIVIQSVMEEYMQDPLEARIFALKLDHGGHLSHSSQLNITGKIFRNTRYYSVNKNTYLLDYDKIHDDALLYKPHLIICGSSSYPREINFKRFGEIADDCNAILLSDISHIFGLVVSGVHQNPVNYSSFITSSTYKAGGPRGGLIIAGKKSTAAQRAKISRYIFPFVQGTPDFGSIASKAAFFKEMATREYQETQFKIVRNAGSLADNLKRLGYRVLTDGTDNHMIMIDIMTTHNMTGQEACIKLSECGINANKNLIPYDRENAQNCSGIRFGTNTITRLGMNESDMKNLAQLIDEILSTELNGTLIINIRNKVKTMMKGLNLENTNYF